MDSSLETLLQKRVDGLLLMSTEARAPSHEVLNRYPRLPMVMMDWSPFEYGGDIIQDNSLLGEKLPPIIWLKKALPKLPVLQALKINSRQNIVCKAITMPCKKQD